jgi:hypothetical protein
MGVPHPRSDRGGALDRGLSGERPKKNKGREAEAEAETQKQRGGAGTEKMRRRDWKIKKKKKRGLTKVGRAGQRGNDSRLACHFFFLAIFAVR